VVGEQFGGMERLTYSHEYVHALQDQNYDIQYGLQYDTDPCKKDSERCAGVQALLEGDASLAQMDWFTNMPQPRITPTSRSFILTSKCRYTTALRIT